jgi:hypothetical protein
MGLASVGVATASGYLPETITSGTMPLQRFALTGSVTGGSSRTIPVTNTTNSNPIAVNTTGAHGLATGNIVTISGVTGNTNANGTFKVIVIGPSTFTLVNATTDVAPAGNGVSGGTIVLTSRACITFTDVTMTGYTGWNLEIRSGAGVGQVRRIISIPTADSASVFPEWSEQPNNTSNFWVWVKRGPIYLKSFSFFAGSAAMGNCNIADGQSGEVLIQLGPAAGLPANGTLNWASQTNMGIPFMVGPYLTMVGTGAFLSYEFERT